MILALEIILVVLKSAPDSPGVVAQGQGRRALRHVRWRRHVVGWRVERR